MSSSSRSSRISALSDKIQGLKFMQRASASASTSSSSTFTSPTTPIAQEINQSGKATNTNGKDGTSKAKTISSNSQQNLNSREKIENKVEDNTDKNDEHWSLPNQIKRIPKKPSISRIEAQVGWNDWLDQFQNHQTSSKNDKSEEFNLPSARKSFGSWAKDSKQKSKEKDVREEEEEEDYERSIDGSSKDESFKKQGFIKPGTISNTPSPTKKQTNKKRKSDEHEQDDNDEILLNIRKDKKKKKKESSKNEDNHSQARKESALKKRKDMASNGKASKRKKEGFVVPDLDKDGDSEEFDSSDIEATLGGFHE